jgi:hypothetical protein
MKRIGGMAEEGAREEQLKLVQDARVYPVGRVLRGTFDAENHDSLTSDVTGLMINLARVPFEPLAAGAAPPPSSPPKPTPKPGLFARIGALFRG